MTTSNTASTTLSHRAPGEPPTIKRLQTPSPDVIEVDVQLITHMLGGGARPREYDRDCWLRASAIKGHLRFWWRAIHAHEFATIQDMRARERALFGAPASFDGRSATPTGGPGVFTLSVQALSAPAAEPFTIKPNKPLHYVYFSARKEDDKPAAFLGSPGATATITIRFTSAASSADRIEIRDSFRTWLLLGGVGSRTRRGGGSLRITRAHNLTLPATKRELESFLKSLVPPSDRRGEPSCRCFSLAQTRAFLLGKPVESPENAHESLMKAWIQARRGPRSQRNRQQPRDESPRFRELSNWNKEDRLRLGSATPRHASPVLLSVVSLGQRYVPVVVATKPHVSPTSRDDEILDRALGAFRTFDVIKP